MVLANAARRGAPAEALCRADTPALQRDSCAYTPCFCEENVHLLLQTLADSGVALENLYAVFISNPTRQVPLWQQRAGEGRESALVVWDYHVLCLQRRLVKAATGGSETAILPSGAGWEVGGALVWDLDTVLAFPVPLGEYAQKALWNGSHEKLILSPPFRRLFRVVHAPMFLRHFASDRSHMRTPEGTWSAQPPPYPCIVAKDGGTNRMQDYVRMDAPVPVGQHCTQDVLDDLAREAFGVVLAEDDFVTIFSELGT